MTPPAQAGLYFLRACGAGCLLGLFYGFLRPLRRKHPFLADSLFLPALLYGAVYVWFGICRGDVRLGYTAGLGVGAALWELTVGQLLRPVFAWFYTAAARFFRLLTLPLRYLCKKIISFAKNLFASWKKWVTIKCNHRRRHRRQSGGSPYEEPLPKHQAGLSPQQQADQASGAGGSRVVYGDPADPGRRHSQRAR